KPPSPSRGRGGCAGTRLTAVPCPSAPTLPVAAPQSGVSLGDTVTLRCHLPQLATRVWLCQDQRLTSCMVKYEMQIVVDFYITTNWEHAGTYRCQYQVLKELKTSEKSDPVHLVLTGEYSGDSGWLCAVSTWLRPTTDYGATFLLHKDGHSAPLQHRDPDDGSTATFTLFRVTPADSGTYRCSYLIKGYFPLLSSPRGDNVTVDVTPTPAHPGTSMSPIYTSPISPMGGSDTRLSSSRSVSVSANPKSQSALEPPDSTREPQSLPMGNLQDPQPHMPWSNFMCTPKFSPWKTSNGYQGGSLRPTFKFPDTLVPTKP
uniref:Ig-like domain-containing protein n=1 Tax=Meleagris gallopavo TaxID=9103 RepID=A0A803XSQ5_MELGA